MSDPKLSTTSHIQETDPRFGVEAALSEFDALFTSRVIGEKNDRRFNNRVFGNLGNFKQDVFLLENEITKRTVGGSQFTFRNLTDYDANNSLTNEFGSSWNTIMEGEVRQPLLQGAGVGFNRIAGPTTDPAGVNGVLIARIRTDISIAEFETAVRDFVSNVENAYWDLYFAYRDLEARISARDASLETWNTVKALRDADRAGGEAEEEAQAREQYFRFEQEVRNALTGRLLEGTRTNNGSAGGTLRPVAGVQVAERRLRLLLGLPINENRLIRPADEPSVAPVVFDWAELQAEALTGRVELRRQEWLVRRAETELVAQRNFLLPRLDFVGRYRWRGFGKNLDDSVSNFWDGDFQEWQAGLELESPIGFRKAHVALRNAQLKVARSRAVLREIERQIVHNLSNAYAETKRAFQEYELAYNRLLAAQEQVSALDAKKNAPQPPPLDVVLDAQRRVADAKSRYYQVKAEYTVAVKNIHFEKGSLLGYCGVFLSEGPWPHQALHDAAARQARRRRVRHMSYAFIRPLTAATASQDSVFASKPGQIFETVGETWTDQPSEAPVIRKPAVEELPPPSP